MGMLRVVLVLIEIVSGALLIGVILLQKSKDEGLGLAFGAGVGETLFGSRAGNVLTKITIGLAVVFMANTLLIGYVMSGGTTTGSITDDLPNQSAVPVQAPMGGVALPASPEPLPAPGALAPLEQPVTAPVATPVSVPESAPVPATPVP